MKPFMPDLISRGRAPDAVAPSFLLARPRFGLNAAAYTVTLKWPQHLEAILP
jgi:hypothetical protein